MFDGGWEVGAVDFGELAGEAATGGIAAVEDAVGAEGGDGGFGEAGGGIAAGEVGIEIRLVLDGSQAEVPVAAGVAADEGDVGEMLGEGDEVIGGGFAGVVAAGFDPGVLEDDGFQLGGASDQGVQAWVIAAAGDPEFDADHGAVGDAALELGVAGIKMFAAQINKAKEAVGKGGASSQDVVVLLDELFCGGVLQKAQAHINAEAFDAHAVRVANEVGGPLFGGEAREAGEMTVEVPDAHA